MLRRFWALAGVECALIGSLAIFRGVDIDVYAAYLPAGMPSADSLFAVLGWLSLLAAAIGGMATWRQNGWLFTIAALLVVCCPSPFCTFAALFFAIAAVLTFRRPLPTTARPATPAVRAGVPPRDLPHLPAPPADHSTTSASLSSR